MINLTVDEIQLLHKKLIKATGGLSGIRDLGLLESAVYGAMQSFGDEEAYPEPEQRASRLAFAITQNHPFLDGNKRTGMMAMLMTLRLNNVELLYTQQELIQLGLSVADGSKGYHEILEWIYSHKENADTHEARIIMEGLEDMKAGRTVDGDTAINDIRKKFKI